TGRSLSNSLQQPDPTRLGLSGLLIPVVKKELLHVCRFRHRKVYSFRVESRLMQAAPEALKSNPPSLYKRFLRLFHPSRAHSALPATLLLITSIMLSRVIGLLREMYIAWAFGATPITDAYNAGFTIPDWLNYLVAGGTASITFVSIYTRFLAEKREDDARRTFSAVITIMTA